LPRGGREVRELYTRAGPDVEDEARGVGEERRYERGGAFEGCSGNVRGCRRGEMLVMKVVGRGWAEARFDLRDILSQKRPKASSRIEDSFSGLV